MKKELEKYLETLREREKKCFAEMTYQQTRCGVIQTTINEIKNLLKLEEEKEKE